MTTDAEKVGLARLAERLVSLLPAATLDRVALPLVPELRLWLIADTLRGKPLDPVTIDRLMSEPPYWSFCWASGQVLARYLLDHPQLVAGRTVVDVGPGSGVVAIAAAMAGARRVIACDLDPDARLASAVNAAENGVRLEPADNLAAALADADLVTAADILYDRDNLALVARMRMAAPVLLADSRVRDLDPPGYAHIGTVTATTWPDLDESQEFNRVRLFAAGDGFPEPLAVAPVESQA